MQLGPVRPGDVALPRDPTDPAQQQQPTKCQLVAHAAQSVVGASVGWRGYNHGGLDVSLASPASLTRASDRASTSLI